MFFKEVEDNRWEAYSDKGIVLAKIYSPSHGTAYITEFMQSPDFLLSGLEMLSHGARMIADRHPAVQDGELHVDYKRVKFCRTFIEKVEFGDSDEFNGFIEGARIGFGHY